MLGNLSTHLGSSMILTFGSGPLQTVTGSGQKFIRNSMHMHSLHMEKHPLGAPSATRKAVTLTTAPNLLPQVRYLHQCGSTRGLPHSRPQHYFHSGLFCNAHFLLGLAHLKARGQSLTIAFCTTKITAHVPMGRAANTRITAHTVVSLVTPLPPALQKSINSPQSQLSPTQPTASCKL